MEYTDTLKRLAGGFLFLLGIAAITEFGLSSNSQPTRERPTYRAVYQVSVMNVTPTDTASLLPEF